MNSTYQLSLELGQHLLERQWFVVTAESCTGGGISQAITDIPGSSQWFSHGFVTYSNQAKERLLAVDPLLLDRYGAVSQPVVEAMSCGALKASGADIAVAVSGIAGPQGGSDEKSVGTVWLSWAQTNVATVNQCFVFSGDRKSIRNQSVIEALRGLIKILQKNTV